MPQNKNHTYNRKSESGNIFAFILIGVVLFAALSFTVARGFRSDTTSSMSDKQAALSAADILNYAQRVGRTVDRLRRSGISEGDISFDNDVETGYDHTPAQPAENQVFNADGGGLRWLSPESGVNDASPWLINGETCIADLGTGATGCDSDSLSNEELLLVLPNIDTTLCEEINDRLNIDGIPADTGGGADTTKFQGSFGDGTEIILANGPFETACFSRGGNNFFYSVLIAR